MAQSSLDMVREAEEIEVEWKAFELRPEGSPPPDPAYLEMVKSSWPRVQQMGRQFGIEMRTHRPGTNTRLAHRALKILQALAPDQAEDYNRALFRAYFEEGGDLGDVDVLVALAADLGVNGEPLREQLEGEAALDEVLHEEQFAYGNGISGVPAFVFMDKYLVTGVQPPEQLSAIIEQIRALEEG
jgi:predicted DsbA family dithiol-disulfide isomerase